MDGLVAVVFVAARWMRGGIRRRSFSACSHLRTIAALLVSQCPLTRRSFKRALGLSLFVYFLVFVSDIFALQNAVLCIWHLLRRSSWHFVGLLLDGLWNLKRIYADMHMIYMYLYKWYGGDPDICIFAYLLAQIGCSLTGICLCALVVCVCWLLDEHRFLKRNYVCMHVCMYVCMNVCMYICICEGAMHVIRAYACAT